MSEATIRAAIKTKLEGVSGIGVVHDRPRYSRSAAEFLELMRHNGTVNGWQIHRQATPSSWANDVQAEREFVYSITGTYAFNDEENSDAEFNALIEAVYTAFLNDNDLGGVARDSDPVVIAEIAADEVDRALYHICELILVVRDRQSIS